MMASCSNKTAGDEHHHAYVRISCKVPDDNVVDLNSCSICILSESFNEVYEYEGGNRSTGFVSIEACRRLLSNLRIEGVVHIHVQFLSIVLLAARLKGVKVFFFFFNFL